MTKDNANNFELVYNFKTGLETHLSVLVSGRNGTGVTRTRFHELESDTKIVVFSKR